VGKANRCCSGVYTRDVFQEIKMGFRISSFRNWCSCALVLAVVLLGGSPAGVDGARFIGTIKSPESWVFLGK
jgi:hypothetical protein